MYRQRFVMLGINGDSYDAVMWAVTSQFSGPLNNLWLNRKRHGSIPDTFDSLVTESCKTALLLKIKDDAINALIELTQVSLSYASCTRFFNYSLRRSHRHVDFQRVRLINGFANFHLETHAKSHRS
jgi:hypothetical protein